MNSTSQPRESLNSNITKIPHLCINEVNMCCVLTLIKLCLSSVWLLWYKFVTNVLQRWLYYRNQLEVSSRDIPCATNGTIGLLDLPGLVEQLQSWLCKASYTAYCGHIQAVGVTDCRTNGMNYTALQIPCQEIIPASVWLVC